MHHDHLLFGHFCGSNCSGTIVKSVSMSSDLLSAEFGPHTESVHEVLRFVFDGNVLSGPFQQKQFSVACLVISSLDSINRYRDCWEENAAIQETWWFDQIRFTDQDKHMFGGYLGDHTNRTNYRRLEPLFQDVVDAFTKQLEQQLAGILPQDEIEIVIDDLATAVCSRSSLGRSNTFPELLLSAYLAKGYPCGWEGAFPSGRLVVFSR
jgi:hypothetical protein